MITLVNKPHVSSDDPFDKPPCRGCSSYLVEPYIKCAECGPSPFLLCLQCFTRGYEYKKHQSDHKYEIMVKRAVCI
uniref:ZZ-type domain-containing protein n=1 Tax=Sinocyclocheilus grahami TaxID=75366 RepID=A0A672K5R0_SINGR